MDSVTSQQTLCHSSLGSAWPPCALKQSRAQSRAAPSRDEALPHYFPLLACLPAFLHARPPCLHCVPVKQWPPHRSFFAMLVRAAPFTPPTTFSVVSNACTFQIHLASTSFFGCCDHLSTIEEKKAKEKMHNVTEYSIYSPPCPPIPLTGMCLAAASSVLGAFKERN